MRYRVEKQRVGTVLEDVLTGRSVFFQPGDDEAAFEARYEPLADLAGSALAAAEMWCDYGHLAVAPHQ